MLIHSGLHLSKRSSLIHHCQEIVEIGSSSSIKVGKMFDSIKEDFENFIESINSPREILSDNTDRIYIDGCWDIMHSGHFNAIRQAKMLGKTLVVGVHSDEEIMRNKGMSVMNNEERVAMVKACKWVDEVVENAPYSASIEWLDSVNCNYIAHGDDIAINCDGQDAYGTLKSAGRFKVIKRTEGISTTSIVGKLLLMTRENKAAVSEPFIATEISSQPRLSTFTKGLITRL